MKSPSLVSRASSSRMLIRVPCQANNILRARELQYSIGLSNPINCRILSHQSFQKVMNRLQSWLSSIRTPSWLRHWTQSSTLFWPKLCSVEATRRGRISSSMVIWGLTTLYWHRELLKWQFISRGQTLNHPTSKTSSWLKSSSKLFQRLPNWVIGW